MATTFLDDELTERWRSARTFVLVGSASIVAGGLVAAASGPTGFDQGSWLAAYLVLVGGVAQVVLGAGQSWLAEAVPSQGSTTAEAWAWNAGGAAVVVGTLVPMPILTSVGGVATGVALGLFLAGVRRPRRVARLAGVVYRGVGVIVLASIPIGLALAWIRRG